MILNESKKRRALVFLCKEKHEFPKVSENYNRDLLKDNKVTKTDNFNQPKVRKMTKFTHPKLVN